MLRLSIALTKFFERVISDTYYIREISTGNIYAEAVNVTVNTNDYEEVTTMPLPVIGSAIMFISSIAYLILIGFVLRDVFIIDEIVLSF